MEQEKIDFQKFREEYNISAADIRAICKRLKLEVVREGTKHFIVGTNPYNVPNKYYLHHAVLEYRGTLDVLNTMNGNFFEFELDTEEGAKVYGVHQIGADDVEPKYSSAKVKPKKQPKTLLVPVDKGAELMMRQISPPAPPEAPAGADALQVLVAALTEAQKASQAPNPLHPQKTLLEAEEQGFLITTEQLGEVLGMSKGTISSKKSGFRKLGFQFEKVKEGNTTLWKVKRY